MKDMAGDVPRKILICSAAFYPEISPRSFRATELAKEFVRQGHTVRVISLSRSGKTDEFCKRGQIDFRSIPNLRFKSFSRLPSLLNRLMNRLFLMLFEYPDVELAWRYRKVLKQEEGHDILISMAVPYPVHWGVAWARTKEHPLARTWVADCGDPFMGNRIDSFRKLFYFGFVEKWMFRKADYITIPIEAARAAYYPEFWNKIKVIPQGINFEEFTAGLPPYKPNDPITFAYSGSFIAGRRDPRAFLKFLNAQDHDYSFLIFTNMQGFIADEVAKSRGRVRVFGYIPRKELISRLATVDFLVNLENSTSSQAPSKLIDYYLAGRPVLSVCGESPDRNEVIRFLNREFETAADLDYVKEYRIENIGDMFLKFIG